jgi:hypothetical protein
MGVAGTGERGVALSGAVPTSQQPPEEIAMPISHPVRDAASFLQSGSATPKEKLAIGGKLLWGAMIVPKDWTPELLDRARMAYGFLLKHGNMKRTVEQMDEKDASRCLAQFTKDVTQLATDIEHARSQQPRRHKS